MFVVLLFNREWDEFEGTTFKYNFSSVVTEDFFKMAYGDIKLIPFQKVKIGHERYAEIAKVAGTL